MGKPESAVVLMELLMWLEQIAIWRLQREHASPKQEDPGESPVNEQPIAAYPKGEDHMLSIIILTVVIGAALVVGCLISAHLQSRRPRRLPGPTIVRHTMYLLPERRER